MPYAICDDGRRTSALILVISLRPIAAERAGEVFRNRWLLAQYQHHFLHRCRAGALFYRKIMEIVNADFIELMPDGF
jgi:hypothetical protein